MFTPHQCPPDSIPLTPRGFWGTDAVFFEWNWQLFDSKHEAAFAQLLCRYVKEFDLRRQESYQIPVNGKFVDFCVCGALVEYHPVTLYHKELHGGRKLGDFAAREEYLAFRSALAACESESDEIALRRSTELELQQAYVTGRTELIRAVFPQKEIIFAHSPAEFYLKVFVPNSEPDLPGLEPFLGMFWSIVRGFRGAGRTGEWLSERHAESALSLEAQQPSTL